MRLPGLNNQLADEDTSNKPSALDCGVKGSGKHRCPWHEASLPHCSVSLAFAIVRHRCDTLLLKIALRHKGEQNTATAPDAADAA